MTANRVGCDDVPGQCRRHPRQSHPVFCLRPYCIAAMAGGALYVLNKVDYYMLATFYSGNVGGHAAGQCPEKKSSGVPQQVHPEVGHSPAGPWQGAHIVVSAGSSPQNKWIVLAAPTSSSVDPLVASLLLSMHPSALHVLKAHPKTPEVGLRPIKSTP